MNGNQRRPDNGADDGGKGLDTQLPQPLGPRGASAPIGGPVAAGANVAAVAAPPRERLVRVSKFEVLINSNYRGAIDGPLVRHMEHYLREELFTEAGLTAVIATDEQHRPDLLRAVDVQAPSIEVGSNQQRVHAHFILRVRHCTKVNLGRTQALMQAHVRAKSIFRRAFVSIRLLNARADNYALKETFLTL